MPMLWLLLGVAFRRSMSRAATVALAFGILMNLWLSVVFWAGSGGLVLGRPAAAIISATIVSNRGQAGVTGIAGDMTAHGMQE